MSEAEFDCGDVPAIHVDIMGRLGRWPSALRDEDALDRVLQRIDVGRSEGADVIRRVAGLAVGLIQERPFEHGNLPTAFATLESYLSIKGFAVRVGSERRIGSSFASSQKSTMPRPRFELRKFACAKS